ncbi:signal peptidase II [Collinsella sp. AGMB00827]|uniref:Lipoprotein signal peptidase n=2 Tax=Collinsella ureilytica TaxID=2869515 RepID=A0ABS7MHP0_9ACTN|nr:signal peptidase II [Collinsella urealyticum]
MSEQVSTDKDPYTPFSPLRRWRFAVVVPIFVATLLADQLSKEAIRQAANGVLGWTQPLLPGFMSFTLTANTGAAFSLGEGKLGLFICIAVVSVLASGIYLVRARHVSWLEVCGLALVAGGAVGNALDRMLHGSVTDFLATDFINFPVFNIADIAITLGVLLAFIGFAVFVPASSPAKASHVKNVSAALRGDADASASRLSPEAASATQEGDRTPQTSPSEAGEDDRQDV